MSANRIFAVPGSGIIPAILLGCFVAFPCLAQNASDEVDFFNAIASNDTNAAAQLLESNTNLAHSALYGQKLPLLEAAAAGNVGLIKRMIELGVNIDASGDTFSSGNAQATALHVAIRHSQPAACKALLEAGANPNLMAFGFETPLHLAFTMHQDEIAGWLLDYGADPFLEKMFTNDKTTPFETDVFKSDGRLVARMLGQSSPDSNALKPSRPLPWKKSAAATQRATTALLSEHGPALLTGAVERGELEAVQALIKAGVSAKNHPGPPVLQTYARSRKSSTQSAARWTELWDLLLTNGAPYDAFAATGLGDIDQARRIWSENHDVVRDRDDEGQSLLHWAVLTDQPLLTSFWLQAGASPNATNSAGQTALHLAAARGLAQQVTALLESQIVVNLRDTNGWTALDAAIKANQTETIRLLLKNKNVEPHSERGVSTPLHRAAAEGDVAALTGIVMMPDDLEARNELGLTPLQVAVRQGHLAAAAFLVDKGANIQARDPDGNTLLHQILQQDSRLTIHDRPPTNWFDRRRSNPRMEIYRRNLTVGQYEQGPPPLIQAASFLLACGVDVNAANNNGYTVVRLATDKEVLDRQLLFDEERMALLNLIGASGANINEADASGNTALHRAVKSNGGMDGDEVERLIRNGANINATNREGRTPLHALVQKMYSWGETGAFQALLRAKPDVNARDTNGLTPLHVLAAADTSFKEEAMTALLDAGATADARDHLGRTPVHLLFSQEWPWRDAGECVDLLLQHGADFSARDAQGKTPLHYLAAVGDHGPMFFIHGLERTLTNTQIDLQPRDRNGDTPLHVAARTGTRDVFDWLLKRVGGMDATNNAGETPRLLAARFQGPFKRPDPETDLFDAARAGKVDVVRTLLKADAALAAQTDFAGITPLRTAAMAQQTNVIEVLEQFGAQWDEVSAALVGRVDAMRTLLLQQPARVSSAAFGQTLMHIAADRNDVEMLRLLLLAHADLQATNSWGVSPLGLALVRQRTEAAAFLRQRGAKENIFDAVYAGDLETTSSLLAQKKSPPDAVNGHGSSLAEIAASEDHVEVLQLLLDKGAKVNVENSLDGQTPLHAAAAGNRTNAIPLLIRRGANVEARDRQGLTPLHQAALLGSADAVGLLLKFKANPDQPVNPLDPDHLPRGYFPMATGPHLTGATALHLAAMTGQTNVLRVLLDSGASINAADRMGRTALDITSGIDPSITSFLFFQQQHALPLAILPKADATMATLMARRQAAASLLATAGGKRASRRSPAFGPAGFQ